MTKVSSQGWLQTWNFLAASFRPWSVDLSKPRPIWVSTAPMLNTTAAFSKWMLNCSVRFVLRKASYLKATACGQLMCCSCQVSFHLVVPKHHAGDTC